ncbi:hypothetical protein DFJ73DRAFT_788647 [Zopfochytrium polystomum]|nr:hypothetical protein DFJ73DRAFT_788647 [Zopfochytrium polystomum]
MAALTGTATTSADTVTAQNASVQSGKGATTVRGIASDAETFYEEKSVVGAPALCPLANHFFFPLAALAAGFAAGSFAFPAAAFAVVVVAVAASLEQPQPRTFRRRAACGGLRAPTRPHAGTAAVRAVLSLDADLAVGSPTRFC